MDEQRKNFEKYFSSCHRTATLPVKAAYKWRSFA